MADTLAARAVDVLTAADPADKRTLTAAAVAAWRAGALDVGRAAPPDRPARPARPELKAPRPFYSGQAIGTIYADMARDTPPYFVTAYTDVAESKLEEAFANTALYYKEHGDEGLRDFVRRELVRCADYVRRIADRKRWGIL